MKKSLLATVAAAALIAGPAFAQKQEAPASGVKGAAPPPAAIQNAPAEKMAPAGQVAPDRAAQDKASPSTNGQASPSPRAGDSKAAEQPKADMKARPDVKSDTKAADKPNAQPGTSAQTGKPGADAKSGTTAQGGAAARPSGASVNLTTEQRAKVRTTVLRGGNAPRVTNINFSLNVGTVVPRTVRVVAVPPTLVEIHPAWRGYMYFVHNDRIVIVEPGTMRIVTIIVV
jgi:hypothetical protein